MAAKKSIGVIHGMPSSEQTFGILGGLVGFCLSDGCSSVTSVASLTCAWAIRMGSARFFAPPLRCKVAEPCHYLRQIRKHFLCGLFKSVSVHLGPF